MTFYHLMNGELRITVEDRDCHYEWRGGDVIGITDYFMETSPAHMIEREGDLLRIGPFMVRLIEHDDKRGIWLAEREYIYAL